MKLKFQHNKYPDIVYGATNIDGGSVNVIIEDAFIGPCFISTTGEKLYISLRDGGFHLKYRTDKEYKHVTLVDGKITELPN